MRWSGRGTRSFFANNGQRLFGPAGDAAPPARIFHSLCHRHDHSPAGGSYDGDSQRICGLSPDVPASALGPRIVHSLHAGHRVECETSGLARPVHSGNGGVVASVLPMQCGNAWSPDTAWIAPAAGAGSGDPALQLSAVPVRSAAIVALRRAGHSAHSRVLL